MNGLCKDHNPLKLSNQLQAAQAISPFDVEITARLLSWWK